MRAIAFSLLITVLIAGLGCNANVTIEFDDPKHIDNVLENVSSRLKAKEFNLYIKLQEASGETDSIIKSCLVDFELHNDTSVTFKEFDSILATESKFMAHTIYDGLVDKSQFDRFLFNYTFLNEIAIGSGEFKMNVSSKTYQVTLEDITGM